MLGKISEGVHEVLVRNAGLWVGAEYKYDGQRGQIHWSKANGFHIFSRHLEDTTTRFPDICKHTMDALAGGLQAAAFADAPADCTIDAFILDVEVVAVEHAAAAGEGSGAYNILPFQRLSTRPRKDVKLEDISVHACVFAFDMIMINGTF